MRVLLSTVLLSFVMAGCTSIDPYTGQQQTSNTTKGAAAGAVAGAILGAVINHDNREKGALAGAAIGAGAGGGYGYYMDRQEAVLRQQLAGTGVGISRQGDTIQLVMPGNITFDTNQFVIKANFYDVLQSVAVVLAEYDKTDVAVNGFTDSTGSFEHNQKLSENRAQSVARFLANQGVSSSRLLSRGYGPRHPIASNDTVAGRAQNRRVELQLVPQAQ